MGNANSSSGVRKSTSLPTSPETRRCVQRSSAIPHKGGSSIPLPGSALPSRKCPPDKVRPIAGSSRASSPALSMIPRGAPASQISSPYQQNPQQQKNSMLDKLKLFKSNDKPTPVSNGKRTSSSSGVSSARSERSDSSVSLEPSADVKPVRNASRIKQTRPAKTSVSSKNSPNANKKEVVVPKTTKADVEKHATKLANLSSSKLTEPKVKVSSVNKTDLPSKTGSNLAIQNSQVPQLTNIPKPTAAIKGTTKVTRDEKNISLIKSPSSGMSRESSQVSMSTNKPVIALVSPMKNDQQLSESSHSTSTTGPNSSDSSVIYKPSSESSSEYNNVIYTKKESSKSNTEQQTQHLRQQQQQQQQNHNQIQIQSINHNNHQTSPISNQQEKIIPNGPREAEKIQNKLNNLNSDQHNSCNNKDGVIEEETSLSIEPMRPLFRGYCSTLTLPSRHRPSYQMMQPEGMGDYCEIAIANGYLSDGEILRNPPREATDGYLSEGGSVLYARRLQTMPAHIPNG
ncbi:hypothetical protein HHI36_011739 [Cryptolaemus montrouzieri]|uniref:Uncharacterized protein n=1 Tax=Cryptolaemus montrouzieri TaxID=559131 RepID=A0ABD2NCY4_9CUCU